MATQLYATEAQRTAAIKGDTLKHAVPRIVLGSSGDQKKIGKNTGDTVVYRRWVPQGGTAGTADGTNRWSITAAAYQVDEGVTPAATTIAPDDITVQLQQYACLFAYSDKAADLYEDKIPDEMKLQVGETMGLVREKIDYGALKGCTNKFYGGGTTRATVNGTITLNMLRKISKSILGNRGDLVRGVLKASGEYNTAPIEGAFIVYAHTDCEHDIRELPGFIPCAAYSKPDKIGDAELGSCDRYRFMISPELSSIADSGLAVGSDGMVSTSAANNDVYPIIVVGKSAWANVALRGRESFDVIDLPAGKPDKADPLGQRGYLGAKFYSAAFVQNDGWMAVAEVSATDI